MTQTMYDKLGDLLNETLAAGHVKFVRIEREENPQKEKKSHGDSAEAVVDDTEKKSSKCEHVPPKKNFPPLTPELERAFRLLAVTPNSSEDEIKRAYKAKLQYFHPDKHQGNEILKKIATDKTRQIMDSYSLICGFMEKIKKA